MEMTVYAVFSLAKQAMKDKEWRPEEIRIAWCGLIGVASTANAGATLLEREWGDSVEVSAPIHSEKKPSQIAWRVSHIKNGKDKGFIGIIKTYELEN